MLVNLRTLFLLLGWSKAAEGGKGGPCTLGSNVEIDYARYRTRIEIDMG